MRYLWGVLFVFILALAGPGNSSATVEKGLQRSFTVPETPLASVSSGDGKTFFVLSATGKVFIYGANGEYKDTLAVDGAPDLISVSHDGSVIYLTSKQSGKVQVINVDYVQEIKIAGDAIRGDRNGAVTIALFSDFQ